MNGRLTRGAASCRRALHTSTGLARGSQENAAALRAARYHQQSSCGRTSLRLTKPSVHVTHQVRSLASQTYSSVPPPASKSTDAEAAASAKKAPISDISKHGFSDAPPLPTVSEQQAASNVSSSSSSHVDWTRSFSGLSETPFSAEAAAALQAPIDPADVEIKPDGILYLPEIKYRRILNKAFGPGGWGLAPRGETIVTGKAVTREYALVVLGRLVSVARGEQDYFSPEGIPTAAEGCKSNALLRCCKDLGVASELWDPRWIREFTKKNCKEVWVEHVTTKKKRKISIRKDDVVSYPYKESKP